ncbi:MAG: S-layer homology domain-containing protein [Clostridiaceae bacterium]|nr:S-layer homology domain-containing protein [Clostridiaceae bacterium]
MKGYKGILGLAIALMMVISSFGLAFASGMVLTDISNHWAKEYIEDIYERGITRGYSDATFKPGNQITKPEIIAMVANLLEYDAEKHGHYISKYSSDFSQSNTAAWAQGPVAYAIEKNILSRSDIKNLSGNARRHEVAVYIGRVLEHHAGESLNSYYVLPYRDEMSIPQGAKVYIDLLLRKNILNPESNDSRFLPVNLITRGEVAKMISEAAAILDKTEDVIVITIPKEHDGIFLKLMKGNRTIISVLEEGKEVFYDVAKDVKVSLDRKRVSLEDLTEGHFLKLESTNNEVVVIDATTNEETLKGQFSSYIEANPSIVTLRDEDRRSHVLTLLDSTLVTLDGEKASLRDFRNGDEVKAVLSGDYLLILEGTRKDREVEGIITAKGPNHRPTLDVKTEDGETKTFSLGRDATIRRNRSRSSFEDLRLGDDVVLQMEYDEITSLTASSVRGSSEGILRQIVIGDEIKITIRDRDGDLEEYIITNNTIIRIDGSRADVYDLRLNYDVDVDLENNEVTRLNAESFVANDTYTGRVASVHRSADVLEMEISDDEILSVNLTGDTIILRDGADIRLRDIKERDRVTVIGQQERSIFIADTIIVH